jgi:hypothetical protein
MMNHMLRQIIDKHLEREDRRQSYLAKRLGRSPEQLGRWINGYNQIPYHVVREITQIFRMTPVDQVEFYAAAGYPLPTWAQDWGEREEAIAHGARMLPGEDTPAVRRLSSDLHYTEYLEQRLRTARHSIEEHRVGIDDGCTSPEEAQANHSFVQTILELCRRRVVYRGLTLTDDHLLHQTAAVAHRERLRTYNVRTLAPAVRQRLHMLDFIIIDGKEAIFSLHHHSSLPADREMRLAIRHPDIVAMFRASFEAAWATAHVIKEGDELARWRIDPTSRRRAVRAAAD